MGKGIEAHKSQRVEICKVQCKRMQHKRVGVVIHLGKLIVVEGVRREVVDVVEVLIQMHVITVREWGIGVKIVHIRISSVTHVIRWGTPVQIAIRETSKGTIPISMAEGDTSQEVVLVAEEVEVGVVASKPTEDAAGVNVVTY